MKNNFLTLLLLCIATLSCTESSKDKDYIDLKTFETLKEGELITAKYLQLSKEEVLFILKNGKKDTIDSESFRKLSHTPGALLVNYNSKKNFYSLAYPAWKICPEGCTIEWRNNGALNDFICDCDDHDETIACEAKLFRQQLPTNNSSTEPMQFRWGQRCESVDCNKQCNPSGGFFVDKETFSITFLCNCGPISDPGNPTGDPGDNLFPEPEIKTPPSDPEN